MGILRILLFIAVLLAVAWLFRDVLKRVGAWLDDEPDARDAGPEKGPRLLAIERSPYAVLGLPEGASPFEVERAFRQIMKDNAPERVAELSPELQAHAERLRRDATDAWQALQDDEA
ncbi:MAG: J domain-containing protein [Alphaproteobacteria bacterium]|nr:J domain-containing protein [Alphaproteobacteria bacterium]